MGFFDSLKPDSPKPDQADDLKQAIHMDDPETARNLLKSAGGSCAALDLARNAVKKGEVNMSLDEIDGTSDRLSVRFDHFYTGTTYSLPVVSIIIDKCKR